MKKFLIVLSVVFLPITILILIFKLCFSIAKSNRIRRFVSQLSMSQIDAISGVDFEDLLCWMFRYYGFKTKTTKRSGDYGVDLFAKSKHYEYCIQAKLYYNHSVGASAIQQINTALNYYHSDYAVVITNSRYSKQAVDMAQNLGVLLLDRTDLNSMLENIKVNNKKYLKKLLEEKCLRK